MGSHPYSNEYVLWSDVLERLGELIDEDMVSKFTRYLDPESTSDRSTLFDVSLVFKR